MLAERFGISQGNKVRERSGRKGVYNPEVKTTFLNDQLMKVA
jgi:hypothetical protein